jgi:2-C-methyl-D-erythritol 4-phosphate cytidylyltransferase
MKKIAIIVAGGSGTRMKTDVPKQFLLIHNKPVIFYTIEAFFDAFDDIEMIVVLPNDYLSFGEKILHYFSKNAHQISIVTGGDSRFQSVKNGLQKVANSNAIVFVHDAARCLVNKNVITNCYNLAVEKGNAIPCIAATDSIRIEQTGSNKTIDRNAVKIIQTPQTFVASILIQAFQQPFQQQFTDEASVVETLGIPIFLCQGEENNIKITKPIDLLIASQLLS